MFSLNCNWDSTFIRNIKFYKIKIIILTNLSKGSVINIITMFIRNYKGKIVYFDSSIYHDEKSLYSALWKIQYNIEFAKISSDTKRELINFIE